MQKPFDTSLSITEQPNQVDDSKLKFKLPSISHSRLPKQGSVNISLRYAFPLYSELATPQFKKPQRKINLAKHSVNKTTFASQVSIISIASLLSDVEKGSLEQQESLLLSRKDSL